jgi:hypothetical protein
MRTESKTIAPAHGVLITSPTQLATEAMLQLAAEIKGTQSRQDNADWANKK